MKRQLRVLQLASFEGNVGDNANTAGTRRTLAENLSNYSFEFVDLEIREFYWKKRFFDDEFAEYVNQFDLMIIGGGNYFELWVDHSHTGTSIDISLDILKKIKTKTVFYALGCDVGQGASDVAVGKFKKFLDYVLNSDQFKVSVRNDGSHKAIREHLGNEYAEKVSVIPDGGFFVKPDESQHPEIDLRKRNIAINLAGDMLGGRYSATELDDFLADFSGLLATFMDSNPDVDLILIPHIFKDLEIIARFLYRFSDEIVRRRITIAPYIHGEGSESYIFDLYRHCDLVIGNRFHANVCPIAMGIPTIGLVNYPQVRLLYEELGLEDRMVDVNDEHFFQLMYSLIESSLDDVDAIKEEYAEIHVKLRSQLDVFHSQIDAWL